MLIDTEQAKRRLVESGVSEEQAGAHRDVLRMVSEQSREELATKQDLERLEQEIDQRFAELRSELKQDIEGLRSERQAELRALQTTMYRTAVAAVTFLSVLMALFRFL
jgi:hypothetical protein